MKHIILLDPIEKLNIKKDSSLMIGLSLKEMCHQTYLLFAEDFFVSNTGTSWEYSLYNFKGSFALESFYLDHLDILDPVRLPIEKGDVIHMRLDPPFDTRYLRTLWMLKMLVARGVKVVNGPDGILLHNEKLLAYQMAKNPIPSFIGGHFDEFCQFLAQFKKGQVSSIIIKPLDLYQGLGVERIDLSSFSSEELRGEFSRKVQEFGGVLIAQPFLSDVLQGEVRSLYYKGHELGSILKVPSKGQYLANIAQGASYGPYQLTSEQREDCERICQYLGPYGVDFIAFDILGPSISEVNITCPGLLVEVSSAMKRNLAMEMVQKFKM